MPSIICTPVTKKARDDYIKEQPYFDQYDKTMWNDNRHNKAKPGDYFAFIHNKENRAEMFVITAVLPPVCRRSYWNTEGHENRNVLLLSRKITEMTWDELRERMSIKKSYEQGTTRHTFH